LPIRPLAVLFVIAALLGAAVLVGHGCGERPAARSPGPIRVVVSLPPLVGLTKPLLPEGIAPESLMQPGQSEHGHELTMADRAALDHADVVVFVGLGLDASIQSYLARHPRSARRDVCFADVVGIRGDHGHEDDGHEKGAHDHHGPDPHLWLDADLCRKLLPAIDRAVREVEPGAPADALARLDQRIADWDAAAKKSLAPLAGKALVTHHNAWSRFVGRYGLTVVAVLKPVESGEETLGDIQEAERAIREQGVKAIFVEPQYSRKAADGIKDRIPGLSIGVLNPIGDGDWFKMMQANVDELVRLLGG
jgi:ABC-type Zn uptake system ZnuABC Zn-binding protein ZnuA